jgi:hypothetical protein
MRGDPRANCRMTELPGVIPPFEASPDIADVAAHGAPPDMCVDVNLMSFTHVWREETPSARGCREPMISACFVLIERDLEMSPACEGPQNSLVNRPSLKRPPPLAVTCAQIDFSVEFADRDCHGVCQWRLQWEIAWEIA